MRSESLNKARAARYSKPLGYKLITGKTRFPKIPPGRLVTTIMLLHKGGADVVAFTIPQRSSRSWGTTFKTYEAALEYKPYIKYFR